MTKRWTVVVVVAAGVGAGGLTACADDDEARPDVPATDADATVASVADADTTAPATAAEAGTTAPATSGTVGGGASDDPCTLVQDELVAGVVTGADAEALSNDYGDGFVDCAWTDSTSELLVSIVPAANLQSDYVDQLVEGPEVDSDVLGDEAIGFDGLVGIGRVSSLGTSVAFPSGDVGVIVAVRTGEDGSPNRDRRRAVEIAEAIAGQR